MAFVYQRVFSVIYTGTSIRDLFHVFECMVVVYFLEKHGELLLDTKKKYTKDREKGALLFHFNLHIEFKAQNTPIIKHIQQ